MNVGFFVPVVVAAALASSCDDEGGLFDSLRSESSVYYYNQITSQGAEDQSNLTVDFTVEGDESDSVDDVGYSREDEAPELNVRIDDANDAQIVSAHREDGEHEWAEEAQRAHGRAGAQQRPGEGAAEGVAHSATTEDEPN